MNLIWSAVTCHRFDGADLAAPWVLNLFAYCAGRPAQPKRRQAAALHMVLVHDP